MKKWENEKSKFTHIPFKKCYPIVTKSDKQLKKKQSPKFIIKKKIVSKKKKKSQRKKKGIWATYTDACPVN